MSERSNKITIVPKEIRALGNILKQYDASNFTMYGCAVTQSSTNHGGINIPTFVVHQNVDYIVAVQELTMVTGDDSKFIVSVLDLEGDVYTPAIGERVYFGTSAGLLNGNSYHETVNSQGQAIFDAGDHLYYPGVYDFMVKYDDVSVPARITVERRHVEYVLSANKQNVIRGESVTLTCVCTSPTKWVSQKPQVLSVHLHDDFMNSYEEEAEWITLPSGGRVTDWVKIDDYTFRGTATFTNDWAVGTHTIQGDASTNGSSLYLDGDWLSNTISFNVGSSARLVMDQTSYIKEYSGILGIQAALFDDNGEPAVGKTVTFNVNGLDYNRTTGSVGADYGKATLNFPRLQISSNPYQCSVSYGNLTPITFTVRITDDRQHDYSLSIVSGKSILFYDDGDITTIDAILSDGGSPVATAPLSYSIKHGSTVLDSGTATTNSSGVAMFRYAATGVGEVTIEVKYGSILQETHTIYDYTISDAIMHLQPNNTDVEIIGYNNYATVTHDNSRITITTGAASNTLYAGIDWYSTTVTYYDFGVTDLKGNTYAMFLKDFHTNDVGVWKLMVYVKRDNGGWQILKTGSYLITMDNLFEFTVPDNATALWVRVQADNSSNVYQCSMSDWLLYEV